MTKIGLLIVFCASLSYTEGFTRSIQSFDLRRSFSRYANSVDEPTSEWTPHNVLGGEKMAELEVAKSDIVANLKKEVNEKEALRLKAVAKENEEKEKAMGFANAEIEKAVAERKRQEELLRLTAVARKAEAQEQEAKERESTEKKNDFNMRDMLINKKSGIPGELLSLDDLTAPLNEDKDVYDEMQVKSTSTESDENKRSKVQEMLDTAIIILAKVDCFH